jgi:uncharacterized protein
MPNPVTHFEIIGKDAKQLQEYYASLFGWNVDANNPMNYGLVGVQDGKGTGGGIGGSMDGQQNFVTIYVEVDNPQAYLDKAVSLGGKVLMPVMEIPGAATIAQFQGPSGNLVGLVQAGTMSNPH